MRKNVSIQIICWSHYKKKNGKSPIKLRLTINRKHKYFPIGVDLEKEEFDQVYSSKAKGKFRNLQIKFSAIEKKANTIIENLPVLTFDLFEEEFYNSKGLGNDVFSLFEMKIQEQKDKGSYSNAEFYQAPLNSLIEFHPKPTLLFEDLNKKKLEAFEKYLEEKGLKQSTISMYFRNIRAVFNFAIQEGFCNPLLYPFGKGGFTIPQTENIKKALNKEELNKILNYTPETKKEVYYYNIWVLIFYCNGSNVKDLINFKNKNLEITKDKDGQPIGVLTFFREKTKKTKKKGLNQLQD